MPIGMKLPSNADGRPGGRFAAWPVNSPQKSVIFDAFNSDFRTAYNKHMRLAFLFFFAASSALAADPSALQFDKDIAPVLNTFCSKCHTGDKVKGDISLAPFKNDDAVQSDPKLWRTVLGQLADYTMPPKTKPQ